MVLFDFLQDLFLLSEGRIHLLEGETLEVQLQEVSQALILFLKLIYDGVIFD